MSWIWVPRTGPASDSASPHVARNARLHQCIVEETKYITIEVLEVRLTLQGRLQRVENVELGVGRLFPLVGIQGATNMVRSPM
eukprot:5841490-Pyramimonas_sp.AAC.2